MTRNRIQLSTSSQKCLTLQTIDDMEFYDWLYAISPLLVGQLRYAKVYNCTLTRAMDGRNLRCSTIGSCQSTATSYDCTARLVAALLL